MREKLEKLGETWASHYFRAFSQAAPGHKVWAFSRLAHSKSVELPRNKQDYTGNVRGKQEVVTNVAIIFAAGPRKAEGGRLKAEGGRQKAEGRRRKAEGRRRKAEGGRRKAEGGSQKAEGG